MLLSFMICLLLTTPCNLLLNYYVGGRGAGGAVSKPSSVLIIHLDSQNLEKLFTHGYSLL